MLLALGVLIVCAVSSTADRQTGLLAQAPPGAPPFPAASPAYTTGLNTNDFRLRPLPPIFAVGHTVSHAGAQMSFRILAMHGEWILTDQGWIHVPSFWSQQQPFWR
jgi:hypothetical protein